MIQTKLAKKVLTKKEQEHLTKDAAIHSKAGLERQVKFMKECDPEDPGSVCRECMYIAQKLGMA